MSITQTLIDGLFQHLFADNPAASCGFKTIWMRAKAQESSPFSTASGAQP